MRFETRSFDHADLGPDYDPPAPALGFLPGDPDLHPEDAFLREFRRFLRTTLHLGRSERAVADELAREALDAVDGPDGDFSRLSVERWLVASMPARARHQVGYTAFGRLALAFVTFLRASGRVSPGASRRLRGAIAGLDPAGHALAA